MPRVRHCCCSTGLARDHLGDESEGGMRHAPVPWLNFPVVCIGVFAAPSALVHTFGGGSTILAVSIAAFFLAAGITGVVSSVVPLLTDYQLPYLRQASSRLAKLVVRLSPVALAYTPELTGGQAAVVRVHLRFTMKALLVTMVIVASYAAIEYANLLLCSGDESSEPLHVHHSDLLDCSPFGPGTPALSMSIWFTAYEFQLCLSACLASVGISVVAWNLAFVRLLVEAQAEEHTHTSAMLRWLSHECRSPVAAALLTLESVFQDNLPGAVKRLREVEAQLRAMPKLHHETANPKGHYRLEDTVHSTKSTHGHVHRTGLNANEGTTARLPVAVLPKSDGAAACHSAPPVRTANVRKSMFEESGRRAASFSFKMPQLMLGGFRSQRSLSYQSLAGLPNRHLHAQPQPLVGDLSATSDGLPGKYWLSTKSHDGTCTADSLDTPIVTHLYHSRDLSSLGLEQSNAVDGAEHQFSDVDFIVSELNLAQHDLERIAQPLEALGGVLDDMLLYSQRRDQIAFAMHVDLEQDQTEHSTDRDGVSTVTSGSYTHTGTSDSQAAPLGSLNLAAAWMTAWQAAVVDKDVAGAQGEALLRFIIQDELLSQRILSKGIRAARGFRLFNNEGAMAALHALQLESIVSQSSTLQVMANFLTNALKYGQSENAGFAQIETNVHIATSASWMKIESSLSAALPEAVGLAEQTATPPPTDDTSCTVDIAPIKWMCELMARCCSCCRTIRRPPAVAPEGGGGSTALPRPSNPLDVPIASVVKVAKHAASMLAKAQAKSAKRACSRRGSRSSDAVPVSQPAAVRGAAIPGARNSDGSQLPIRSRSSSFSEWQNKQACVLAISVTDHGKGMSEKRLEKLFEPFAHLRKAGHVKGNGLGLWLTKQLLELHGGSIHAHSGGAGSGCTFTAVVPAFVMKGSARETDSSGDAPLPPQPQHNVAQHTANEAAYPSRGTSYESSIASFEISRTASIEPPDSKRSVSERVGELHPSKGLAKQPKLVAVVLPVPAGIQNTGLAKGDSRVQRTIGPATGLAGAGLQSLAEQRTAPTLTGTKSFAFSTMDSSNDAGMQGPASMPLPPVRKAGIAASASPARAWSRADRVLVVDDAKTNRVMLTRRLRKKGLTVRSAEDGKEALGIFTRAVEGGAESAGSFASLDSKPPFQAIVSDMTMPNMMGDELAERVLALCRAQGLAPPVIIGVTGNALTGDVERFKRRGADEVLLKPVSSDTILQRMHELLLRQEAAQQAGASTVHAASGGGSSLLAQG